MVRITNDAEGKVVIGLLEIEKGRQAENDGVHYVLTEMLGYEPLVEHNQEYEIYLYDSPLSLVYHPHYG